MKISTSEWAVALLFGWEGDYSSGVTTAIHHSGFRMANGKRQTQKAEPDLHA